MKRRTVALIIVLVVLATAAFFLYRSFQQKRAAAQSDLQTETIQRDTVVAIVGATGTVRSNQTAVLSWQTTGQVGAVNVAVEQQVQTDQVLAELKPSSLPQSIIAAKGDLITAKKALEDLKNNTVPAAQAQVALANAVEALRKANDQRASKEYRRASDTTLETARTNYLLAQNTVDKAQDNFDLVKDRPEDDYQRLAANSALQAAIQKRDVALANYKYLQGSPNSNEVAQADANATLAQAQLEAAQREYDRLKDGPDPNDIQSAEAKIAALEATLEMATLKAPFDGTITDVNINVGDQVAPGMNSFRIDDMSRLLVDVEVTEVDINRVLVDQPATLTFDAVLGKEYHGKVVQVGQVGTNVQGVVNFNVTIELTDPDESIHPGMTAAVNIAVNRAENVLAVPNQAIRLRDGQRVIYLLKDGQVVPVRIELGATSDTKSEIINGDVKEGDQVVLNPPTQFPTGRPSGTFGR